ncbi:protein MIZU-KUSSEI 1 [Lotus japonicus]|uniref:protein MIZU-KUSSEI 1 n=1 Tax=Lotus japonicus TaxID=34305 RepID=UPI002584FE91|nr:protein MIZU-KUSSEI 1 [Lotus japonicus]
MKQKHEQNLTLQRSKSATASISTRNNNRRIIATNHHFRRSSEISDDVSDKLLVRRGSLSLVSSFSIQQQQQQHPKQTTRNKLSSLLCSFLNIFTFQTIIPTCKWLTIPSTALSVNSTTLGRKVTGTLFGHRRGNISFAVQLDPRSEPVLLLELAISTSSLVKEMSSGLVRIALECRKSTPAAPVTDGGGGRPRRLFHEPAWSMYCNGRKCGYAVSRPCGDLDWHVLSTVQSVSAGAGVIPGELMYMRARFERVVGSRDSEAFYMLNPDGNGGPELSIFLLRL